MEYNRIQTTFNRLGHLRQLLALLLSCLLLPHVIYAGDLRVAQYVAPRAGIPGATGELPRNYPNALTGLLANARRYANLPFSEEPLLISSFHDERLAECPLIYINWGDRERWDDLPEPEILALREYLQHGGFLLLDAGIAAEFLRNAGAFQAQHHSFAEWQETPDVRTFFRKVLPDHPFEPVTRDDPIFSCLYQGLPDPERLPPAVREYTRREKWPNGTYSAVAIRLNGHIAVLATPILAMGWGMNALDGWTSEIRLRVLEGESGLSELLPNAAVLGERYAVRREDGASDEIFCQQDALPAWVHEPTGRWRVFRYYDSRQISDYTHIFYTRLGINFLTNALLGE